MAKTTDVKAAIEIGQKNALDVLKRRASAREKRKQALSVHPAKLALGVTSATAIAPPPTARETAGFLVAMGDSWFDYPFYDVLKLLEDNYGYDVESSAHRGDPLEAMAYNGGQLDKLSRCFEKITDRGASPKAVLISGGGDDIAGNEFGMLLNNAASPIAGWNADMVTGLITDRILRAYVTAVEGINQLSIRYAGKLLPILIHGYDYPVPDGRGVLGGWGPLPGPWLKPGFQEKLFDDLPTTVGMMHDIIDSFNAMLNALPMQANFTNIHIVDLRGTLSASLVDNAYKDWWGNELHPTEKGFTAVTDQFAKALGVLP